MPNNGMLNPRPPSPALTPPLLPSLSSCPPPQVDTELVYAYARSKDLAPLEDFITSTTHMANLQVRVQGWGGGGGLVGGWGRGRVHCLRACCVCECVCFARVGRSKPANSHSTHTPTPPPPTYAPRRARAGCGRPLL